MQLFFLFLLLNIILFLNLGNLSKLINIYDKPDNKRKFHKDIVV